METTILLTLLLLVYGGGVWKFWGGFEKTSFNRNLTTRLFLAFFWPVLLVNKSYRQNFTKILKG